MSATNIRAASHKFEIYSETLQVMGISPLPVYREPPLTPISKPDLAKEFPLTLMAGVKMWAKFFDSIAPDVVSAQHGWWFPEEAPPEYGWKKSSANLLFGDTDYDPDTGSESLGNGLCRIYPVSDNR